MKKGIFCISIDYEFAWGYADTPLSDADKKRIEKEVDIVNRLIILFQKYNVPATWAVVGHLLEKNCSWNGNMPHPEYPRPIYVNEKNDWFFQHPKKEKKDDVLWFDSKKLIEKIAQSKINHEIGSHSYAHLLYNEKTTQKKAIDVDIENMERVHIDNEFSSLSFIFPRNVEGYHKKLEEAGVKYYRGNSKKWYDKLPGLAYRLGHLVDYFLPGVRTTVPQIHNSGLINIPESMLFLGRNGMRKIITPSKMLRKARSGLKKASQRKEIFHLWFHPSNFSYDTETQFAVFEDILREAVQLREKKDLNIMTMSEIGFNIKNL